MTFTPKSNPRREYLQQENLRVQASPSLAEKFPNLKTVTVELSHYDSEGVTRSSQVKYTANVERLCQPLQQSSPDTLVRRASTAAASAWLKSKSPRTHSWLWQPTRKTDFACSTLAVYLT